MRELFKEHGPERGRNLGKLHACRRVARRTGPSSFKRDPDEVAAKAILESRGSSSGLRD